MESSGRSAALPDGGAIRPGGPEAGAVRALSDVLRLCFCTSIGRKTVASLTGLGAVGFLAAHLAGNAFAFGGAAALDGYASRLHGIPGLILLQAGLALLLLAHAGLGLVVTLMNWRARPIGYGMYRPARAETVLSRTMIFSGLAVLVFLLFHVWAMALAPDRSASTFARVQAALGVPGTAAFYLFGFAALGLHLGHGLFSAILSLGVFHSRHDAWMRLAGRLLAIILSVGFAGVALWFVLGKGVAG